MMVSKKRNMIWHKPSGTGRIKLLPDDYEFPEYAEIKRILAQLRRDFR